MDNRKPAVLLRANQIAERASGFAHAWNPKSFFKGVGLGRLAGLSRTGVNLLRLPAGNESFVYHAHMREEEWLYVLSGNGIAEVDGREMELSAGDFLAFPTPSVPHNLRNPSGEDLVYLTGGEHLDFEIIDYPRLGKRVLLAPGEGAVAFHDLGPAQYPFARKKS